MIMDFERVERISGKINPSSYQTRQELIAAVLRETARDFPKFRTAATPNEWERGYHTVIETLHDIANEMDQYVKHKTTNWEVTNSKSDWRDFWELDEDPTWGFEWTPVTK